MPRMGNDTSDMEQFQVPNSFAFSGQRIGTLGATEFTVAALSVDKSPRADNMMLRTTAFHTNLEELHGFKTLNNINPGDYDNSIQPGGATALHDGALEATQAMMTYAEAMVKQDFSVNGILIVLTDGDDNSSISPASSVRQALTNAVKDEKLESLVSCGI